MKQLFSSIDKYRLELLLLLLYILIGLVIVAIV
ncbi:hypothetical protein C8D80_1790 [Flavobacterium cheniae]|nr:hypothetical protein C8D80_1790 [Flavobacterium cheniae]